MAHKLLLLLSSLVIIGSCTPGEPPDPPDPVDRTVYPEGPFGTVEGSILEDLELVRDTGEAFSMNTDLYADESKTVLLLSTAAGWCTACIEEQGQLEQFHNERADDGLAIIVTYFEDLQLQPASLEDAAAWRETHGLSFDVLVDADNQMSAYYDETLTPMNMIVKIDTMEIISIATGWDPSVVEAIIDSQL